MEGIKGDIIIAAGGTAGLAAAVTAAEQGAKVHIFEKSGHTGGAARMGAGLFAVESRVQTVRQITLTKEEAFKKHMGFAINSGRMAAENAMEYIQQDIRKGDD